MTDYLPLGSIVTLKQGNKRLMIVGRLQRMNQTGEIFDYSGCLWPEGSLDADHFYLFNHNQIDRLYHIGLQDPIEFEFKQFLKDQAEKLNEKLN